jgi:ribosomal protein S18 acetylase RimI-like enzyme
MPEGLVTETNELTLKDGTHVSIRPMRVEDGVAVAEFFRDLPEEDRRYLREDVVRPAFLETFLRKIANFEAVSLIATASGKVVGSATLYRNPHGWTRHVGDLRVEVARPHQRHGLGTHLARALVRHAVAIGLDKLVVEVVEEQRGALKTFERLGFRKEAVLKGQVRDIDGKRHNLVILSNDVSHLWDRMEALVADFSPTSG